MPFRALGYFAGLLTVLSARSPMRWNSCPEGRTLERQVKAADVVVLGEVIYGGDCRPPKVDSVDPGLVRLDCIGREADLIIRRSWKGPSTVGQGLTLTMPLPSDSAGLLMRKGETHVVFAKLFDGSEAPQWLAETTACMLPEEIASSDSAFVKQLDLWFRTHKS